MVRMSKKEAKFGGMYTKEAIVYAILVEDEENLEVNMR